MNRCLITNAPFEGGHYAPQGLRKLSAGLKSLADLQFSQDELVKQAALRMHKMSVQGVQPKLSAVLRVSEGCFEVVDRGGKFIMKPQNPLFPELPENEDVTMRMASVAGIAVPLHGLLQCVDGRRCYFIKRFDRVGKTGKVAQEDFAQLAGESRDTKYHASIEKLVQILDFCTFPKVSRVELFKRLLFNWLVGNEDMHLKNYSLLTGKKRIDLSPAYDFLNTSIVYRFMGRPWKEIEESALPLAGKKKRLKKSDWVNYLAIERLELPERQIEKVVSGLMKCVPEWTRLIDQSWLSADLKQLYHELLAERLQRLN